MAVVKLVSLIIGALSLLLAVIFRLAGGNIPFLGGIWTSTAIDFASAMFLLTIALAFIEKK